jgi:hypothetical protein
VEELTVAGGTGVIDLRDPVDRPELAPALRIALATGQLRRPLSESLRALLDLLVDGDYEVAGPQRLPDDMDVTALDPWPPADAKRVEYYRRAIRTGHKPVAVLLDTHILDGHHKIAAYQAEGVTAVVVRVTRRQCAPSEHA